MVLFFATSATGTPPRAARSAAKNPHNATKRLVPPGAHQRKAERGLYLNSVPEKENSCVPLRFLSAGGAEP